MTWRKIGAFLGTSFTPGLTVWMLAWWQQSQFWRTAPENQFGWSVPLLGLFLFGEAWRTRPAPGRPMGQLVWGSVLYLSVAGLLISRLLLGPFPGWPSALWIQALAATGFSLALLGRHGGIPWLRHFAWSLAFLFSALPWPTTLQLGVVTQLRPLIAQWAATVVDLMGSPAQASGTTIIVASGQLSVDEACSGILSLQASLMGALFLCEYCRLVCRNRVLVVAGGALWAVFANLLRTCLLGYIAASAGVAAASRWHDFMAFGELVLVFAGLAVACGLLRSPPPSHAGPASPGLNASRPPERKSRLGGTLWLLGLLATSELIAVLIYHRPLREAVGPPRLLWPPASAEVRNFPVSDEIKSLLHTEHIKIAEWRTPSGAHRAAYQIIWYNAITARETLHLHNPMVCLPASGAEFISALDPIEIPTKAGPRRFERLRFRNAQGFFVVYSVRLWQGKDPLWADTQGWSRGAWMRERLEEILRGGVECQYFSYAAWEPLGELEIREELARVFGN